MEYDTFRVKKIVEPYEKRIIELEEKLREQCFENSVLRSKLTEYEIMDKNFSVRFNFNGDFVGNNNSPIQTIVLKYFNSENLLEKLQDKIHVDGNEVFIYNDKDINPQLTLMELGIAYNSINYFIDIYVYKQPVILIKFAASTGSKCTMVFKEETLISDVP